MMPRERSGHLTHRERGVACEVAGYLSLTAWDWFSCSVLGNHGQGHNPFSSPVVLSPSLLRTRVIGEGL